jgi:hypothetical protein
VRDRCEDLAEVGQVDRVRIAIAADRALDEVDPRDGLVVALPFRLHVEAIRIHDVTEAAGVLLRELRFLGRFDGGGEAQRLVDEKILNSGRGCPVAARVWRRAARADDQRLGPNFIHRPAGLLGLTLTVPRTDGANAERRVRDRRLHRIRRLLADDVIRIGDFHASPPRKCVAAGRPPTHSAATRGACELASSLQGVENALGGGNVAAVRRDDPGSPDPRASMNPCQALIIG